MLFKNMGKEEREGEREGGRREEWRKGRVMIMKTLYIDFQLKFNLWQNTITIKLLS